MVTCLLCLLVYLLVRARQAPFTPSLGPFLPAFCASPRALAPHTSGTVILSRWILAENLAAARSGSIGSGSGASSL